MKFQVPSTEKKRKKNFSNTQKNSKWKFFCRNFCRKLHNTTVPGEPSITIATDLFLEWLVAKTCEESDTKRRALFSREVPECSWTTGKSRIRHRQWVYIKTIQSFVQGYILKMQIHHPTYTEVLELQNEQFRLKNSWEKSKPKDITGLAESLKRALRYLRITNTCKSRNMPFETNHSCKPRCN